MLALAMGPPALPDPFSPRTEGAETMLTTRWRWRDSVVEETNYRYGCGLEKMFVGDTLGVRVKDVSGPWLLVMVREWFCSAMHAIRSCASKHASQKRLLTGRARVMVVNFGRNSAYIPTWITSTRD
jgi:hypothetical protein